jgi:hypothetical protein
MELWQFLTLVLGSALGSVVGVGICFFTQEELAFKKYFAWGAVVSAVVTVMIATYEGFRIFAWIPGIIVGAALLKRNTPYTHMIICLLVGMLMPFLSDKAALLTACCVFIYGICLSGRFFSQKYPYMSMMIMLAYVLSTIALKVALILRGA